MQKIKTEGKNKAWCCSPDITGGIALQAKFWSFGYFELSRINYPWPEGKFSGVFMGTRQSLPDRETTADSLPAIPHIFRRECAKGKQYDYRAKTPEMAE